MYISLDIGATTTRIAGFDSLDSLDFSDKDVFSTSQEFEQGYDYIVNSIKKISDQPKAIGIGIAGWVDDGQLTKETNIEDWIDKDLLGRLIDTFKCPVYIDNDAVAQGLAEYYFGSQLKETFLYLTLGTGLGGSIVEGTEAVNLGRAVLYRWEEKVGGQMIEQRFKKPAKDLTDIEWQMVLKDLESCINDLSNKYKARHIVVAGGMMVRQRARFEKFVKDIKPSKISFSNLGEDIGIYGGLALIKQKTS